LEGKEPVKIVSHDIKISQIRTLSADRIGQRLARASEQELARVLDGLNEILGTIALPQGDRLSTRRRP